MSYYRLRANVEAMQYKEVEDITDIKKWVNDNGGQASYWITKGKAGREDQGSFSIEDGHKQSSAKKGDWIVLQAGVFRIMADEIFQSGYETVPATYDPADDPNQPSIFDKSDE